MGNKKQGNGTMYYPDGSKYEGVSAKGATLAAFGFGCFPLFPPPSNPHPLLPPSGSWVDDVRSGTGKYTYVNRDTYEGEWVGGLREGRGTYTYATGVAYDGMWSKGVRSGEGELQYENLRYAGTFTDDQPLGPGRFLFKAGYLQPGEFVMANDTSEEGEDEANPSTKWVGKTVMVSE